MATGISEIFVHDLELDGARFSPPSTLAVKETELSGEAISFYWWDSVAEQWAKVGPANVESNEMVTAPNIQLSRYGLAD